MKKLITVLNSSQLLSYDNEDYIYKVISTGTYYKYYNYNFIPLTDEEVIRYIEPTELRLREYEIMEMQYNNLRNKINTKLVDPILGRNYYNCGSDVYSTDDIMMHDIRIQYLNKEKRIQELLTISTLELVIIIILFLCIIVIV